MVFLRTGDSVSLCKLLTDALLDNADVTAFNGPTGPLTYSDFSGLVGGFCKITSDLGVGESDAVLYHGPNDPRLYAALVASCLGNYNLVILKTEISLEVVDRVAKSTGAKFVISNGILPKGLVPIILESVKPFTEISSKPEKNSTSHISLTSGSLGYPKAVFVDSQGLAEFIQWANTNLKLSSDDIWAECGDYTSDMWINNALLAISSGATIYINSKVSPLNAVQLISESKATHVRSVPQVLKILSAGLKRSKNKEHSLKFVGIGGDIVHGDLLNSIAAWLPVTAQVLLTYGTTEIAGFSIYRKLSLSDCANIDALEAVHLGEPIESTKLTVECLRNDRSRGELIISSNQVCVRCISTGDAPELLFEKQTPGYRGTYQTGDIVSMVESRIIFQGRKYREIIRNGQRIQMEQLEKIYSKVVGGNCVIVEKDNDLCLLVECINEISRVQLIERSRELIPNNLVPSKFRCTESLPRNSRGKLDFARCSEYFES